MDLDTPTERSGGRLSVVVLGNDALIEALPARPIQLANACHAAGFHVVLPASWGDELVAQSVLAQLEERHATPLVFCTCPIARERLFAVGSDLLPRLLATISPSVAVARYARATLGDQLSRLSYVGACPAAAGPEFDERYLPGPFLESLERSGIAASTQPSVFDNLLTPDRRRFWSLPGGCPTPEMLWSLEHRRLLARLNEPDFALDLAQWLISREPVLIDVNATLGCACAGVTTRTPTPASASVAVTSLEPPRATGPVVDPGVLGDIRGPGSPPPPAPASPPPRAPGSSREPGAGSAEVTGVAGAFAGNSLVRQRGPIARTPSESLAPIPAAMPGPPSLAAGRASRLWRT